MTGSRSRLLTALGGEQLGKRSSYTYQLDALRAHLREIAWLPIDTDDAVETAQLIDDCHGCRRLRAATTICRRTMNRRSFSDRLEHSADEVRGFDGIACPVRTEEDDEAGEFSGVANLLIAAFSRDRV